VSGTTTTVAARLAEVRDRIARAARASGRGPEEVTLVAVSKEQPVAGVVAALEAGQRVFGENRAQELVAKASELAGVDPRPTWHFVGRLQRNKVRTLAPRVALWHSIDRTELVPELARLAQRAPVLVQVNVAGETQKGGCAPADTAGLIDRLRDAGIDVVGLMTVPPAGADPRPTFAALRDLGQRLGVHELSMGMTDDFELAIGEGATMVRVGSAVFGPRPGPAVLRR
jgi:pyridoxal phosphate enzyme (YggS family)